MSAQSTEQIIYPDSPEAATYQTGISGWVSRHGRFFGKNERDARNDGATHYRCEECGQQCQRFYTECQSCREKAARARWRSSEHVAWDGVTPLYSDAYSRYFCNDIESEIVEFCDDQDEPLTVDDLRLYVCVPQYAREVDGSYWEDDLPEDEDIPEDMAAAVDALNAVIRKRREDKEPLSWAPGKTVPIMPKLTLMIRGKDEE